MYMNTQITKVFSVGILIACLVSALLFTEFVSASSFREPSIEDFQLQQQLREPVSPPESIDYTPLTTSTNDIWERVYPWDWSFLGIATVALTVFVLFYGKLQKLVYPVAKPNKN
jgi:hypothetical protein